MLRDCRRIEHATLNVLSAERLNQLTYLNARLPYDAMPYDDTDADVLIRGFGYCDNVDAVLSACWKSSTSRAG